MDRPSVPGVPWAKATAPNIVIAMTHDQINLILDFINFRRDMRSLMPLSLLYGNPINRPAIATVDHSESETTATSLFQTGLMSVSSAMTTLRRTAYVKTRASDRAAI